MAGLVLIGFSTLGLFLFLYGKNFPRRCIRGCHRCGECEGNKGIKIKEEVLP